jgi:ABC-2 type transport system ATP-binding protein
MLTIRNLTIVHKKDLTALIENLSFSVSPGERVCVVGANGAGKTTLLRILAALAVPDCGTVAIDGCEAFSNPMRYRHQLGYLPEKCALYEDMTVKKYLVYRANLKGEPPKRVRRRVSEAAEMCRISDLLGSPIGILSAGEKKRVALADAVMLRPRLLLLDDFLAGLDCGMRETAGRILSDAAAFSSVVVSGHEIDDFSGWATRFLVLKDASLSDSIQLPEAGGREAVRREVVKALSGRAG